MIDHEKVAAAFRRFDEVYTRAGQAMTAEDVENEADALWTSVGLSPDVRVAFYEKAEHYLDGMYVDPYSLLFGALWALMAADELPASVSEVDWQRLQDFANGGHS